jgi:hypothetical protein
VAVKTLFYAYFKPNEMLVSGVFHTLIYASYLKGIKLIKPSTSIFIIHISLRGTELFCLQDSSDITEVHVGTAVTSVAVLKPCILCNTIRKSKFQ